MPILNITEILEILCLLNIFISHIIFNFLLQLYLIILLKKQLIDRFRQTQHPKYQ